MKAPKMSRAGTEPIDEAKGLVAIIITPMTV
jgi:hypothetical protein